MADLQCLESRQTACALLPVSARQTCYPCHTCLSQLIALPQAATEITCPIASVAVILLPQFPEACPTAKVVDCLVSSQPFLRLLSLEACSTGSVPALLASRSLQKELSNSVSIILRLDDIKAAFCAFGPRHISHQVNAYVTSQLTVFEAVCANDHS